jgi:hypothetical protein
MPVLGHEGDRTALQKGDLLAAVLGDRMHVGGVERI